MANNTRKTKPKTKTESKTESKTETFQNLERREVRKSPDFTTLYVNSTNFGHTKFDFQIAFGRSNISRDKNSEYVEELAVVVMTPEYAKALYNDFGNVLENYEKLFGEIVLRPHILKKEE